jgi:hypothetical protein
MENKNMTEILNSIDEGKAYSVMARCEIGRYRDYENVHVIPTMKKTLKDAEKRIKELFDNCTAIVENDHTYILPSIPCANFLQSLDQSRQFYTRVTNYGGTIKYESHATIVIKNGEVCKIDSICNKCKHMVKKYVGECHERKFEPNKSEITQQFMTKPTFDEFKYIKPGYIREDDFSRSIEFTKEHIKKRIEDYEARGKWRTQLNKIRTEFCKDCIKYHTRTCQKGYSGYQHPVKCKYTEEKLKERLKAEMKQDFGSMGRAFWFFTNCGQTIQYKDKYTKRKSRRYIAIPGSNNGGYRAKGFYMSLARYPYSIGDYGTRSHRWRSDKEKEKRYENYISLKRYDEEFAHIKQDINYKKKLHEELIYTAYLIYKHMSASPGTQTGLGYGTSYLMYLAITGHEVEVGIGNSKYISSVELKTLKDLFDRAYINIEKN